MPEPLYTIIDGAGDIPCGPVAPPRQQCWRRAVVTSALLGSVGLTAVGAPWLRRPGRSSLQTRGVDLEGGLVGLSEHPINSFNDKLDSATFEGSGLWYEFATANGEPILSAQVEGKVGSWAVGDTPIPLASASKLFTGFAAMRTMQLKPRDFYPEKFVHLFKGWENFKNFPVHGTSKRANLTLHHLLTHTSGLPFGMRSSKEDIAGQTLFYMPGTGFGYTLGHRVVGWILRDYWKLQPEARSAKIQTVQDTYKWLFFDKMGLSASTHFSSAMTELFGYSGQAGDAAVTCTGNDLMKLAVVALRKGSMPDGTQLISEQNWNKWAVPNLLPRGKLSKDLVAWHGAAASWSNWNVGGLKEQIMKQSGDYGWNYFGATYNNSKEIGWCGFFSSCLRVSYTQDVAFVMMQRDTADMKKSKPYMVGHFDSMAKSLQCTQKKCERSSGSAVFCETCEEKGFWTKTRTCSDLPWSRACPSTFRREKGLISDKRLDNDMHSCYVPFCHHRPSTSAPSTASLVLPGLPSPPTVNFPETVFEASQLCYATTGPCSWSCEPSTSLLQQDSGATCSKGVCGCVAGCAGADGKCHDNTANVLVFAGFTLANARWPKYKLYVQSTSLFDQLKTTNAYSWMNNGKDKFSLFKLPGDSHASPKFLLGSVAWPGTVASIHRSGLYATGLLEGKPPGDIALTVCSLAEPAGAVMIGSAEESPAWAYLRSGSWLVYSYLRGNPGQGGYWLPDPPMPAGVLPPCPRI